MNSDEKSPRNKTIQIESNEIDYLKKHLIYSGSYTLNNVFNKVLCGDALNILKELPKCFVDLLVIDPPYNLHKTYNKSTFKKSSSASYMRWLDSWMCLLPRLLKPNATVYICCDWSCSPMVYEAASAYFKVINRITWEREKGRGALRNWKNCSEDIWYFSNGETPTFNLDAVKIKRKVIAPYTSNGVPKDWQKTANGNFRLTAPSNIWTDITVPFWSMPENTEHPTQKPEKLIAKLILASSNVGDVVLDPFLGSGTTAVVANKLGRTFIGIEKEETYCLIAQKRILQSNQDKRIQGYENEVFLERNTMSIQTPQKTNITTYQTAPLLLL